MTYTKQESQTIMEKQFIGYRIIGKIKHWIWQFHTLNKKPAF